MASGPDKTYAVEWALNVENQNPVVFSLAYDSAEPCLPCPVDREPSSAHERKKRSVSKGLSVSLMLRLAVVDIRVVKTPTNVFLQVNASGLCFILFSRALDRPIVFLFLPLLLLLFPPLRRRPRSPSCTSSSL